jgi:phosphoribosylformimino-5-aminoimidazole carboxamide ribotide isomerase
VTAVHREGRLQGPDVGLIDDVVRASRHAVTAAGGIATIDDLRALQSSGASACIIGMALYSGALDARAVAAEFSE